MVSAGLQLLGIALAIIGWIGAIVVCAMPMWKVTAFIGSNIVTAQTSWEGIWMTCVVQSTGQMQCKVYDSMLALSSDLQAARALTIIAIVIGILGIMLAMAGGKCTNCVEDESSKTKVGITAGVIFIIAGVLCLIPCAGRPTSSSRTSTTPCWTKHRRESWEQRFTSAGEPLRCWSSVELCSAATAHQRRKQENTQPNITLHLGLKLLHHPARTLCKWWTLKWTL